MHTEPCPQQRETVTSRPLGMEGQSWDDLDESAQVPSKDADAAENAAPVRSAAEVDDGVEPGCDLGVECVAAETAGQCQCLEPGRYVLQRIGVHGAAPTLVPGVQGGQEVHHLSPSHLPDD